LSTCSWCKVQATAEKESERSATSEEPEAIQDGGATEQGRTRQFIWSCYSSKRTVLQLYPIGHFAKFCSFPKKQQNQYQARVHHTTIDDILEGEPVIAGMFSINNHLAIILFDSGSSHSFISPAFARKYEQKIVELECAYRISSAGANLLTN
jgi:hypothetical protein